LGHKSTKDIRFVALESKNNPKIKFLDKLKKKSCRERYKTYLIEGHRELMRAFQANLVTEVYFCQKLFTDNTFHGSLEKLSSANIPMIEVGEQAYQKISIRENGDGLIGLGKPFVKPLDHIRQEEPGNPLIIAAESLEKPSNLGAIIRTAESAGATALAVLDASTDPYNPNTIRSSQGAIFSIPIIGCSSIAFDEFCHSNGLKIICTTPHGNRIYWEENLTNSLAIIVGSEARGLSDFWLRNTNSISVKIPQLGSSDSLNVSVATAVVTYEAVRQRNLIL
jgi:TrmH family RNA methyltransferase